MVAFGGTAHDTDCMQSMKDYSKQHSLGLDALDTIRHIMRTRLAACDGTKPCPPRSVQMEEAALFFDSGPFWQRVFASWSDPRNAGSACKQLDQVLATVGAKRAIAGHTIQVRTPTHADSGFASLRWSVPLHTDDHCVKARFMLAVTCACILPMQCMHLRCGCCE